MHACPAFDADAPDLNSRVSDDADNLDEWVLVEYEACGAASNERASISTASHEMSKDPEREEGNRLTSSGHSASIETSPTVLGSVDQALPVSSAPVLPRDASAEAGLTAVDRAGDVQGRKPAAAVDILQAPTGGEALLLAAVRALKRDAPALTAKQVHERLGPEHHASMSAIKRCCARVHREGGV